ncbi:MAG TPA: hypothetical protein VG937_06505 [Polyangiaceae bacterium]|nr:hypothetical protein [Polyangiaceae bacterium]
MTTGKQRRRRQAALALAGVALAFVGLVSACSDPYAIPPTDCDDFCYATQRAGCDEDYPEGCVSDCEHDGAGRRYPKCVELWHELTACYRATPDSGFECVADKSRPRDICLSERAALAECAREGADSCVRNCFHSATECGKNPAECEEGCYAPPQACNAEQIAYDTCALNAPVYCGTPEEDTRSPEQIPCYDELVTLLVCAGFGDKSE